MRRRTAGHSSPGPSPLSPQSPKLREDDAHRTTPSLIPWCGPDQIVNTPPAINQRELTAKHLRCQVKAFAPLFPL